MARLSDTIEKNMFYGAKQNIFAKANTLRHTQTKAEIKLWKILRNKQMLGLRFKRQHPISIFIADFYCHSLKLVIEVDGDVHLNKEVLEHDKGRTSELENFGLNIIRFTNDQIFSNIDDVKESIVMKCIEIMELKS